MAKIKICGITNIDDALISTALGADFLGFIFYSKSKRYIDPGKAKEIISQLPSTIGKVGVFVNEEISVVNSIANNIGLTSVQLHGNENQKFINQVKIPVIKSFRIKDYNDIEKINYYNNCSLLLDSFSDIELGGTGKTFDWNIIPYEIRSKIFLAGGISSKNVEHIFRHIRPYGIDLSSSVEVLPGIKDHKKLNDFFSIINKLKNEK